MRCTLVSLDPFIEQHQQFCTFSHICEFFTYFSDSISTEMAAKMDRKLNRKMEEHLLSVQRETKAALDGFKGSGFKVDKEFVDNFLKLSVDRYEMNALNNFNSSSKFTSTLVLIEFIPFIRMTQTCRYYAKEAESKTKNGFKIPKPVTMPLATNVSATIDLTASPLNKKKRISGDVSNVEQTKMSELIDFNLNSLHQYTAEEGEF